MRTQETLGTIREDLIMWPHPLQGDWVYLHVICLAVSRASGTGLWYLVLWGFGRWNSWVDGSSRNDKTKANFIIQSKYFFQHLWQRHLSKVGLAVIQVSPVLHHPFIYNQGKKDWKCNKCKSCRVSQPYSSTAISLTFQEAKRTLHLANSTSLLPTDPGSLPPVQDA